MQHFTGQPQAELTGKIYFPSFSTAMIYNYEAEMVDATNHGGPVKAYNMYLVFSVELKRPIAIVGQPAVLNAHSCPFIIPIIVKGTKQRCGASSVKA